MKTIASSYNAKENAIGFLRLIFALIVVVQHSFALLNLSDPLSQIGMASFGAIGVNGFFVLSGFLITASWLNTKSFLSFFWRRVLRIFPAFLICLIFTSFIIGTGMARLQGKEIDFAFLQQQLGYIYKNILLVVYQPSISNLTDTHFLNSLNGSLWTLSWEFLFYIALAIAGIFGLLTKRKYLLIILICFYIISYWMSDCRCVLFFKFYTSERVAILPFMFAMGIIGYLFKNKVPNHPALLLLCTILWIIDIKYNSLLPLHPFLFSYVILWLVVNLPIKSFEKHGDYSYGIYIYHFPIIQLIISIFNYNINPWLLFTITLLPTGILAYFSWHYIEKSMLSYKKLF